MRDIWFISDTHFGHANILTFTGADGAPVRPGFDDVRHMDDYMVTCWNETIKPDDRVYHLGDVGMSRKAVEPILPQLHGQKRLLLGNHDTLDVKFYRTYFKKVASWRHFTEPDVALVCTHCPLHESSFLGRYDGTCLNVHGHIHRRTIDDPRYRNVCVEVTDYYPVHYDTLIAEARQLSAAH